MLAEQLLIARGAGDGTERSGVELVARLIAQRIARENPAFDKARFLKAAGVAP